MNNVKVKSVEHYKELVFRLLGDRPVAYRPDFARICDGVCSGIFMSQLFYWSDKGKRDDDFIWKTQTELERETALNRREQEKARKKLRSLDFVEEKKMGVPAKLHYRIKFDVFYDALEKFYVQTSMSDSAILECRNCANYNGGFCQCITENTTESTTETTTKDFVATPRTKKSLPQKIENDALFIEFWDFWDSSFPGKTHKRENTSTVTDVYELWQKAIKLDGDEFLDNWKDAVIAASKSDYLTGEKWFNMRFFLNKKKTLGFGYLRCLNGDWEWKDKPNQNGRYTKPIKSNATPVVLSEDGSW